MFSPGRGKTVSTVKAIEQLLEHDPNARIVAWTLNDSDAADLITQKLMHLGATDVFCVSSMSRMFGDFTQMLHKFSLNNENQAFVMPTMESVLKYRVVVSRTCVSAGTLPGLGLKLGHFAYIFIDKTGQGKEPENTIPIKGFANKHANVVLAGDLKQLCFVVHSRLASL